MKTTINSESINELRGLITRCEIKEIYFSLDKLFNAFIGCQFCSEIGPESREPVYKTHMYLKVFFEEIDGLNAKYNEKSLEDLFNVLTPKQIVSGLEDMFMGFIETDLCSVMDNRERALIYLTHKELKSFFEKFKKEKNEKLAA